METCVVMCAPSGGSTLAASVLVTVTATGRAVPMGTEVRGETTEVLVGACTAGTSRLEHAGMFA